MKTDYTKKSALHLKISNFVTQEKKSQQKLTI